MFSSLQVPQGIPQNRQRRVQQGRTGSTQRQTWRRNECLVFVLSSQKDHPVTVRQSKSSLKQFSGRDPGDREPDFRIRRQDVQQVGCGARVAANNRPIDPGDTVEHRARNTPGVTSELLRRFDDTSRQVRLSDDHNHGNATIRAGRKQIVQQAPDFDRIDARRGIDLANAALDPVPRLANVRGNEVDAGMVQAQACGGRLSESGVVRMEIG